MHDSLRADACGRPFFVDVMSLATTCLDDCVASFSVTDDLHMWGPGCERAALSLVEAQRYCRDLAVSHYENFPVVTWLLPKHLHQHFYNVYAYCRYADDLGDEISDTNRSLELLAWWRDELNVCYVGKCSHPIFVALAPTIEQFGIPQQPFEDLISAFEQDQRVTDYETFSQLEDYCTRSANPVGRLVLYLAERYNEENSRLSDSICTGLQLANFWQDVARDFEIGRVYLPHEDRQRFGYTDAMLQNRETNSQFLELMTFQIDRARSYLTAGFPLVREMPGRLKVDIEMFIRGGLEILNAIQRIEYRVWDKRPVISKKKLAFTTLWCLLKSFVR